MHRHGYKGKKFGREKDARNALISGLAKSLVAYESIQTTLPKAKETKNFAEMLISKAKKGTLHDRRALVAQLKSVEAANKLVDEIAPKLNGRQSGFLQIKKTGTQRGNNAQMATLSFVDDLSKKIKESENKPVSNKTKKANSAKKDKTK